MSGLYMWLKNTFSSLPEESDSPEASSATADDSLNCQIYSDALEQAGLELDEVVNRIGDLMSETLSKVEPSYTPNSKYRLQLTDLTI